MAYSITKTVKGRKYLYIQESHREGKTVRTTSQYVGAVDPKTKKLIKTSIKDPDIVEKYRQEIQDRIEIFRTGGDRVRIVKKQVPDAIPELKGKPQGLNIKIDCERFKISRHSLEQDWIKNQDRLLNLGIFPKKIPEVSIEYGRGLKIRKRFISGTYVVTLFRHSKKIREHLRREYRRAISLASIEALEKERPDVFTLLKVEFDQLFRDTQTLLNNYIMATNDRDALIQAVMLKIFGNMPLIAGGKLEPKKIGLVEYGKRKIWQDEAASLMSDIQRRGWNNLYSESIAEMRKARNAVHFIIEDKNQWGRRKKKAIKRAEIRIRLNEEKGEKLKILKRIFGF